MPKKKGGKSTKSKSFEEEPLPPLECDEEELESLGVPLDAVVKVWSVHSTPNCSLPWQRRRQERSTGTGFCLDTQRRVVLTNAHVVEWHAQVKLQRRGDDTKYLAKVLSVGWECDLAVLTVDTDEFWEGLPAVRLGSKTPHLEDHVLCVGFPVGGDTISVTSGVISRIEVTPYSQASAELLGIQIDAAINPGNSGGPAFNEKGECVGVAFQSMNADEAENIGYVIPTLVVRHFLDDLKKHAKYTGFPTLGVESQTMENKHLRDAFGMEPKQKGVLVSRVQPTSTVAQFLREQDVLLEFDGEQIGNDGTVRFRKHERVALSWLVAQKFFGESAKIKVLRNRQTLELEIPALQPASSLVPIHIFESTHRAPSYFIVAGLVFTPLTEPFLESEFGDDWDRKAPLELVQRAMTQHAAFKHENLVVLTHVLAHEINIGYEEVDNLLLLTLNGESVRNLPHLRDLVGRCEERFLRFGMQANKAIILRTAEAKEATEAVLRKHGIPAAMSRDLVEASASEGHASS